MTYVYIAWQLQQKPAKFVCFEKTEKKNERNLVNEKY